MKTHLSAPGNKASTQEWRDWLDELKDMPESEEVRRAERHAHKVLHARKQQEKPAPRVSRADLSFC